MTKNSRFLLAAGTAMIVFTASSAQALYDYDREDPYVKPCSLHGVNPVHHAEIFGDPAVAKSYGFVRSRDGTWRVAPGCGANQRRY